MVSESISFAICSSRAEGRSVRIVTRLVLSSPPSLLPGGGGVPEASTSIVDRPMPSSIDPTRDATVEAPAPGATPGIMQLFNPSCW
jgi:hypothetical protein